MVQYQQLNRFFRSFTGRMILGVLLIHILLTPLLFFGILLIVERSFESHFVNEVRNDTVLYASLLKSVAENRDIKKQIEFLNDTQLSGNIIFAEFITNDDIVIRGNADYVSSSLEFREDFYFGDHDDLVYFIAIQLFDDADGSFLGKLKLGYDEVPVQEEINAAYRFGSIIALFYIALSMLLVIFFGQSLISPITRLRNLAKSIASGDQIIDLSVNTGITEIKLLAADLDSMRRNLILKQKEILDRELRLQAVLDNAGEGIITITRAGIVQSFNKMAETIFGYRAEQVLGRDVSMLMPLPHSIKHNEYIADYLRTGVARVIGTGRRVQAQHLNGTLIPIYLTVSMMQLGDEIAFTGIMHDLSSEERREAELQQLWRAVEQSPVSIMITNANGDIEYVNPRFYQVTGYREDEVIGKNPRFMKSDQTPPEVYQDLWITIAKGGIWRGVFQNRKKSGESFWLSSTVCPVRDQENNITHYISINEDITDARKKESMLAQAMKLEAIGRMTDGIAHDFNNLLTIIRGNLKLLEQDIITDDEDTRELVEDALSAAQDGADLIKRLLGFSRRHDLKMQAININRCVTAMDRLLQRSVPDANIRMQLDQDIHNTLIDANRLESAVLNLVTNARDAMPSGGNIVISTSNETLIQTTVDTDLTPGNYVVLMVKDDGIGMDDETRRQAIEPFFTTKTIETGTGLGLTMVNDFVQQCGGKLLIDSTPGMGTSIKMLFPAVETPDAWINETEISGELPAGDEIILVVEDREKVRRFACRTLGRLGYKTHAAENANEALKLLKKHQNIQLLFTDIVMPGDTNGRELAHIAMNMRPDIKVLLTTGMELGTDKTPEDVRNIPLLAKPYSIEQLALSVRSILDDGMRN